MVEGQRLGSVSREGTERLESWWTRWDWAMMAKKREREKTRSESQEERRENEEVRVEQGVSANVVCDKF